MKTCTNCGSGQLDTVELIGAPPQFFCIDCGHLLKPNATTGHNEKRVRLAAAPRPTTRWAGLGERSALAWDQAITVGTGWPLVVIVALWMAALVIFNVGRARGLWQ